MTALPFHARRPGVMLLPPQVSAEPAPDSAFHAVDDAPTRLLARLLPALQGAGPHALLFLSMDETVRRVALAAAAAAARGLCPTLLVEAAANSATLDPDQAEAELVPDASIARLFHRRLPCGPLAFRRGRSELLQATGAAVAGCDLVVIDYAHLGEALPHGLIAASSGTVLVLRAGVTGLNEARAVQRDLRRTGTPVLGAVLADARPTPGWIMRLAPG